MADEFRTLLARFCGKGGVKCYCCNKYRGIKRKVLRRRVRRVLRQDMYKQ